jgi:hypothetical protein
MRAKRGGLPARRVDKPIARLFPKFYSSRRPARTINKSWSSAKQAAMNRGAPRDPPLPPHAQRVAGRGRRWGVRQQVRCQHESASSRSNPHPSPPLRGGSGDERTERVGHFCSADRLRGSHPGARSHEIGFARPRDPLACWTRVLRISARRTPSRSRNGRARRDCLQGSRGSRTSGAILRASPGCRTS